MQERREEEHRRVEQNYLFDHQPFFLPWCARFTPEPAQLQQILKAYTEDDVKVLEEIDTSGYKYTIDVTNGTIRPYYELCIRRNADGKCGAFEQRSMVAI